MPLRFQITGIVLLVLILFQPIIPLLEYQLLYNYIVNELCVEKDVPDSCCQGKCHLEKRLNETGASGETDDDGTRIKVQKLEYCLLVESNNLKCFGQAIDANQHPFTGYNFNTTHSIFHPPRHV